MLYFYFTGGHGLESSPEDQRTILELRNALTNMDAQYRETFTPLSVEIIIKFLNDEIHADIYKVSENGVITYGIGEEMVSIDCRNLPQDMMFGKMWRPDGEEIDWDVVKKAADTVTHALSIRKKRSVWMTEATQGTTSG